MIVMLLRKSDVPTLAMSMPSMKMAPLKASMHRNMDNAIVDLPLPVLPTMPTFSQALTLNDNSRKMGSRSSAYLA